MRSSAFSYPPSIVQPEKWNRRTGRRDDEQAGEHGLEQRTRRRLPMMMLRARMRVRVGTMHWTALVCLSIRERRLLEFDYEGYHRVVAAYCHGVSRSGEVLRAVQVRGASRSGGLGFGKLWTIARMRNARMIEEPFAPDDPDYRPDDSAMTSIHCRI